MSTELTATIEKLGNAFDEFKRTNDVRIKQIEEKGSADPTVTTAIEQINAKLTELDGIKTRLEAAETKANRPSLGGGGGVNDETKAQHRKLFNHFVRKGDREVGTELQEVGRKAVNVTTGADGEYAVPEIIDRNVQDILTDEIPMRGICNVITVGGEDYKKLSNIHGATYGWVDEDDSRAETDASSLAQVAAVMGEIYAFPQATQKSLDDMFFDVEKWISDEIALGFAEGENPAFTSGNGTKKPKGFLAYTMVETADASRTFGQLQKVKTGVAGAFMATSANAGPGDTFIDLLHSFKAKYRLGGRWQMNGKTLGTIRKFKDADGNYIWQPGLKDGEPSQFLGYPVTQNDDMPDVADDAYPVAFGNWKRGYIIVDRIGMRALRDPFTNKPYVGFYVTKRVGGMVDDSNAIKVIQTAD